MVELPALLEGQLPGEDGGGGVGGGRLPALMASEVSRHRAVGRLRQHGLPVGAQQEGGHQAEGAEALRQRVRLHVPVVVLARPDEAAVAAQRQSHHVVDESVLVLHPVLVAAEMDGIVRFMKLRPKTNGLTCGGARRRSP